MMRAKLFVSFIAAMALALCGLLSACSGPEPRPEPPAWSPARVAVLPFQIAPADPGKLGTATSPLTGAVFGTGPGKISPGAQSTLDNALMDILAKSATFNVVPPDISGPVFNRLTRRQLGKPMIDAVVQAGKELNVQAVLVGHIYRYSELVGEAMAASQPASAAFDLALVRVDDRAVLWKNSFDAVQRSLTENVFDAGQYLQYGIRWYKVNEWSRIGLDHLMKRFPWRKPDKPKAIKEQ